MHQTKNQIIKTLFILYFIHSEPSKHAPITGIASYTGKTHPGILNATHISYSYKRKATRRLIPSLCRALQYTPLHYSHGQLVLSPVVDLTVEQIQTTACRLEYQGINT